MVEMLKNNLVATIRSVNISTERDAEYYTLCRSPKLGAEVTPVPKLLVPNMDDPIIHPYVRK